jgi:hypothetical protein
VTYAEAQYAYHKSTRGQVRWLALRRDDATARGTIEREQDYCAMLARELCTHLDLATQVPISVHDAERVVRSWIELLSLRRPHLLRAQAVQQVGKLVGHAHATPYAAVAAPPTCAARSLRRYHKLQLRYFQLRRNEARAYVAGSWQSQAVVALQAECRRNLRLSDSLCALTTADD